MGADGASAPSPTSLGCGGPPGRSASGDVVSGARHRAGRVSALAAERSGRWLERGRLDAVIAGLLFMAGMRRSEVSARRWADVADAADVTAHSGRVGLASELTSREASNRRSRTRTWSAGSLRPAYAREPSCRPRRRSAGFGPGGRQSPDDRSVGAHGQGPGRAGYVRLIVGHRLGSRERWRLPVSSGCGGTRSVARCGMTGDRRGCGGICRGAGCRCGCSIRRGGCRARGAG